MSGQFRMSEEAYAARVAKQRGKAAPVPRSKYGNKKTPADDGVVMDSGREATRYKDLVRMQEAGQITDLRRQVIFHLEVGGVHICDYRADFTYTRGGLDVTEDSKGARTDVYKIKRALMLACHGVRILET